MLKSSEGFKVVKGKYVDVQIRAISEYHISVSDDCIHGHHTRVHAHPKERHICKWRYKNSYRNTLTLLHEIGHIENNWPGMKRAWQEYHATTWAIDKLKEYGLPINEDYIFRYQRYIITEIARGRRRGGNMTGYENLNLFKYIGINKSLEDVYNECIPEWQVYIDGYKKHIPF